MNDLKKYKFSDLYDFTSGISSTPKQAGHGAPFLSFSTVFNNHFVPEELPDKMDTSEKEQELFSVKEGDIFLTRTSETIDELGMSCVAVRDYPKATYSGFVKRLRPLQNDITYHKFMAYYLRSNFFRKTMTNNAVLTLRASLNEQIFSYLDLLLPTYPNQVKIGDLLFVLTQKIETNEKINAELERLVKTIYDYWFVQFDFPDENGKPYKSSGGEMVWNEKLKRNIPKGWEVKKMSELLSKKTQKYELNSEKYNLDAMDLSVMPSSTMCLGKKNSSDEFETNLFKMDKFDILFGGIRPYLRKAGFSSFDGVVTGTVHAFKPMNEFDYNFSVLTMVHESMFQFAISNSKGTKMPVISADDLLEYKVAYQELIVKKFNEILSFKEIISSNIIENHKLAKLRDWLLPMLMNGQVVIK